MKEDDIRPEALFRRYLALTKRDARTYFADVPRTRVPCPACGNTDSTVLFRKSSFVFEECPVCGTLYANPRPAPEIFNHYYESAPSIEFWATHFYKETEDSRRKLLIRPKAERVREILKKYIPAVKPGDCLIDIGAGYGVFCEELEAITKNKPEVIAVEPSPGLQEVCRKKKIPTIGKFFEQVTREDLNKKRIIAATSFELLEHLADPDAFIASCHAVLPEGALLILTTLSWHGFDLQVLRQRSRSIQPPAHINFFNPESVRTLLERHGFSVLDVTTPGKLDVDIVAKQAGDIRCDFVSRFIEKSDEETRQKFQVLLQESKMSSHMMIVAQRN
jgi:2-polyprenyl-3-methyl-5-hydroxy-6-metoxy-1,4-benzoquinol methylase/ribosomal protein S27E